MAWNTDEDSAKEETHRNVKEGVSAYTNADVVVKLQGWDPAYAKSVAQGCLSALKQLILSDKKLPGTCAVLFVNLIVSDRHQSIWTIVFHLVRVCLDKQFN
jgi:hypothetical protein